MNAEVIPAQCKPRILQNQRWWGCPKMNMLCTETMYNCNHIRCDLCNKCHVLINIRFTTPTGIFKLEPLLLVLLHIYTANLQGLVKIMNNIFVLHNWILGFSKIHVCIHFKHIGVLIIVNVNIFLYVNVLRLDMCMWTKFQVPKSITHNFCLYILLQILHFFMNEVKHIYSVCMNTLTVSFKHAMNYLGQCVCIQIK